MIIWLNGTFGAGKTTTARELARLLPQARIFDSELVGYLLRQVITEPVGDFQDLPPWRALVPRTAIEILGHTGGALVIPQTVLVQRYAHEIFRAFAAERVPVRHFVLHAAPEELVARIEGDQVETAARQWRLDHVARYLEALPWLREEATLIDTSRQPAGKAARDIANQIDR
ncbi:AAA family ATPase [Amycolatopsis benzoatilytica]|uniref:AAA family ATPase n=1 Tax=Amycolatopsis benzoatilytica TaxID=346045 RepID=UPI0003613BB7|nr:AAA family ATPase [Amycolatopsis benzoatilytica]